VAEIFPNEGLTHLIEVIPRSNTGTFAVPTALYMGLFSSQTASTVPSADATLTGSATTPYTTGTSPVVELTSAGGYARAAIGTTAAALQAAWPAPVINGAGMRSTMVNAAGYTIRIAAFWHLDG
jgi:hypothetical protein